MWLVLASLLVGFTAAFFAIMFFCHVCKKGKISEKTYVDPEITEPQKP